MAMNKPLNLQAAARIRMPVFRVYRRLSILLVGKRMERV
jgi:hypothetical protein